MSMLLIRHAHTPMAGRFCGRTDPELSEEGRAQAALLAATLAGEPIVQVISSPLRRARQTADPIAQTRSLAVEERAALSEIDFGHWEGKSWEEIERLDREYARTWISGYPHVPSPGGELFSEFTERVMREIRAGFDTPDGLTVVVTHAGVLRVILTQLLQCSEQEAWEQTKPYCCVFRYGCTATGEEQ